MIKGLGVDIVEISRIEKFLEKGNSLDRILTGEEQEALSNSAKPAEYLAGRFAAKEAVSKAFGTGMASCPLNNVEILNNSETGKPYVNLHGTALKLHQSKFTTKVDVSISHEKHYAVAVAIVE